MYYLYTLDSHDCYGPFNSYPDAHAFATNRGLSSYQLLDKPPYLFTRVLAPTMRSV